MDLWRVARNIFFHLAFYLGCHRIHWTHKGEHDGRTIKQLAGEMTAPLVRAYKAARLLESCDVGPFTYKSNATDGDNEVFITWKKLEKR